MATLYVENVPDEIYKALRKRAKANRKSIAAEVIGGAVARGAVSVSGRDDSRGP